MPAGLDEVASIITIVEICVRLFEASIKGFILLKKARGFPSELFSINLMIDIQLLHFNAWAKEVGLCEDPPALRLDTSYAPIVPTILKHLRNVVTNLDGLKRDYGMKLEQTGESLLVLEKDEDLEHMNLPEHAELKHTIKRAWKNREGPWKALKWVAYDAQKMRSLGDQIASLIDELHKILDRPRQARMAKMVEMVERNAVLNTASEKDLDTIGSNSGTTTSMKHVAAAANLKKQGLSLGVLEDVSATQRPMDIPDMSLSAKALSCPGYNSRKSRYIAQYDNSPVLVEFKTDSSLSENLMKDRVRKVSAFLHDLDPSFHGLGCLGYLKVHARYAYVFEIPNIRFSKALPAFRNLRQVLDELPAPSLNRRVAMAITMLETALQLHTSGWLHKEFRSESVLFIGQDCHRGVTRSLLNAPMYIAGYNLARNDDPHEATEPLVSELEADLYRHPRSLGPSREAYHKAFDIFGIGCVLLEVGLWCSLPALLRKQPNRLQKLSRDGVPDLLALRRGLLFSSSESDGNSVHTSGSKCRINADVLFKLEAAAGKAYTEIVMQSFSVAEGDRQSGDNAILTFEMDALERLRALHELL